MKQRQANEPKKGGKGIFNLAQNQQQIIRLDNIQQKYTHIGKICVRIFIDFLFKTENIKRKKKKVEGEERNKPNTPPWGNV